MVAHPESWRLHPDNQAAALRAALAEIGYASALLVRETDKGLELIDGHLRAGLDPEQKVPVLVLDVSEAEAKKLLATLDPIGELAEADIEALAVLVEEIEFDEPDLDALLEELDVGPVPDFQPVDQNLQSRLDRKKPVVCPNCGYEFTTR